jgi:phosphatidylserine decarboxylase
MPGVLAGFSMTRRILSVLVMMSAGTLWACSREAPQTAAHEPVVERLIALLDTRADLRSSLTEAIDAAAVAGIEDLDAFYRYVDELVTWIPVERRAVPTVLNVHYVIDRAPADALNEDPAFSEWMREMARAWGTFLDSPASAAGIASFASMPDYQVDDYIAGPSGWQTFNQFFARELRPGTRPIAAPGDDTVIVSPADAVFMGAWPVDEYSTVTVKGVPLSIPELLDASPYADAFRNGLYMHSFLRITDYHRYHVPVGGIVRDLRHVEGRIYLDVARGPDGELAAVNGDTYQARQQRGVVVLDSPAVGLVALVPVGMSVISSVTLTPEVGDELAKGDPFGYFQFGGSDVVIVFQDRNIVIDAEAGRKYLQGERIGYVGTRD